MLVAILFINLNTSHDFLVDNLFMNLNTSHDFFYPTISALTPNMVFLWHVLIPKLAIVFISIFTLLTIFLAVSCCEKVIVENLDGQSSSQGYFL